MAQEWLTGLQTPPTLGLFVMQERRYRVNDDKFGFQVRSKNQLISTVFFRTKKRDLCKSVETSQASREIWRNRLQRTITDLNPPPRQETFKMVGAVRLLA